MFGRILALGEAETAERAKKILRGGNTEISFSVVSEKEIGKSRKGYKTLLEKVKRDKIDTVICEISLIDVAVRLLWQSGCVERYFVAGATEPMAVEESDSRVQSRLWDGIAARVAENPIEQSGWISSFTGKPFGEEEMAEYVDNTVQKLLPYLGKDTNVLEIGIASGLTSFSLAPKVKEYFGMDISETTICKTGTELKRRGISNVKLMIGEAIHVDEMQWDHLNVVVVNSVAQYFSGYNYFFALIDKLIRIMADGGVIYLGDMLDYAKQDAFESKLTVCGGKRNQRDLWYPREIITELPAIFPQIYKVEISDKYGTIENELKQYRYDAILFLGEDSIGKSARRTKYAYALENGAIYEVARAYEDIDLIKILSE